METAVYEWAERLGCAVTVCDADTNIIYMNEKAKETFAKYGNMIGKNLINCHGEAAMGKIRELLATGGTNAYTIDKGGVKKMIYQTAWRQNNGSVGGLVEISMVTPGEMPHFIR